jgi:NAD+-dependent secondary alcohol dehydrogenase Adh1
MKAARLYAYDEHMNVDLTLEMVPEPTITAADEVIVRVGAAGLCRTDLHIIEGVWRSAMDPQGTLLPYILGHENAGWVEDVGRGVHAVKPGDAVIQGYSVRAIQFSERGCQSSLKRVKGFCATWGFA